MVCLFVYLFIAAVRPEIKAIKMLNPGYKQNSSYYANNAKIKITIISKNSYSRAAEKNKILIMTIFDYYQMLI